jgi:hypothetical protein
MSRWQFWLVILTLGVLGMCSIGASAAAPELKVQKALGVTDAADVCNVRVGSTVTYLANGST